MPIRSYHVDKTSLIKVTRTLINWIKPDNANLDFIHKLKQKQTELSNSGPKYSKITGILKSIKWCATELLSLWTAYNGPKIATHWCLNMYIFYLIVKTQRLDLISSQLRLVQDMLTIEGRVEGCYQDRILYFSHKQLRILYRHYDIIR